MTVVFSSSDVPAIAAALLPRRAARSSLHALAWALLLFVPSAVALIFFPPPRPSDWLGPVTNLLPVILSGAILLVAAAGLILRKLWTILASAAAMGSMGLLFSAAILLQYFDPGRSGQANPYGPGFALILLAAAIVEVVRYRQLRRLLSAADVDPLKVRETQEDLLAFIRSGESFEEGRIRAVVEEGHGWITGGFFRPPYLGQLMPDGLLLISTRRSDHFWFPRNALLRCQPESPPGGLDVRAEHVLVFPVRGNRVSDASGAQQEPVSLVTVPRAAGPDRLDAVAGEDLLHDSELEDPGRCHGVIASAYPTLRIGGAEM
jgi:hypothetical protein